MTSKMTTSKMTSRMTNRKQPTHERGGLEVLEQALALLRDAPARVLVVRLVGDIPFAVGVLFFLTEMLLSPFAPERLAMESLAVAVLYIWKSVWQGVFMRRLHGELGLEEAVDTAPVVGAGRLIAMQCGLQSLALIVVPLALLATIPLPWAIAFFRNAALFAAKGDADTVQRARAQALLWPKQNWQILGIVTLAGLLLFINLLIAIVLVPQIGRTFLGIEGDFTRLGVGILNASTIAIAGVLTWLVIDPVLDAVYVVRCFLGASVRSGEDLRSRLKQIVAGMAASVVVVFVLVDIVPAQAQVDSGPPNQAALNQVDPKQAELNQAELNQIIDRTIRQPEFAWRSKREEAPEPPGKFANWVRAAWQSISESIDWISEKIGEWLRVKPAQTETGSGDSSRVTLQLSMVAVAVVIVGIFVAGLLRRRTQTAVLAQAVAAPVVAAPPVDLNDEGVTADQLPETSWRNLAEELSKNGDYRRALRALYLAALNYLNGRELVSVRRWKSGLDYRRELERRVRVQAQVQPELTAVFRHNLALFERGWYGAQRVGPAEVEEFLAGLDSMRRYAEPRS